MSVVELPGVSILGSSGAGKTALLDYFAEVQMIAVRDITFSVIGRSCYEWNTWEAFRRDPRRYALDNQVEALRKTVDTLVDVVELAKPLVFAITDASPARVEMYTEILQDLGLLSSRGFELWRSEYQLQMKRIPKVDCIVRVVLETGDRQLRRRDKVVQWSNGDELKPHMDELFDEKLKAEVTSGVLGEAVSASSTAAETIANFRSLLIAETIAQGQRR